MPLKRVDRQTWRSPTRETMGRALTLSLMTWQCFGDSSKPTYHVWPRTTSACISRLDRHSLRTWSGSLARAGFLSCQVGTLAPQEGSSSPLHRVVRAWLPRLPDPRCWRAAGTCSCQKQRTSPRSRPDGQLQDLPVPQSPNTHRTLLGDRQETGQQRWSCQWGRHSPWSFEQALQWASRSSTVLHMSRT